MHFLFDQDRQEWITLTQACRALRRRWRWALSGSAAVHILVLAIICWPAAPIFVRPIQIARGEGGHATPVSVPLYLPLDIQAAAQSRPEMLSLPIATRKKPQKSPLKKRTNVLEQESSSAAEAGSPLGSGYDGPASGDEIKPALPVTFQDLKIPRSELPGGVQGDVIVEITIDAQGVVVEERLLQGLGHGVDERVIAVLRDWRFRPATRNGVPIPSKHDVHFHFPS